MKEIINENIELYLGDCLEEMKGLADKSVDLVLTDIPYGGVNRKSNGLRNLDKEDADIVNFDLDLVVEEMIRVSRGSGYIFCGWEQISKIIRIVRESDLSNRLLVWEKTNPSPMNGDVIWLSGTEFCVYWKNKNAIFNEHCKNGVFKFPSGQSKIHPTQKPLELFEYIMSVSSKENDLVLDPFMGSGTTGVACVKLNRKFIGMEISPNYYEISKKRITDEMKQGKLSWG